MADDLGARVRTAHGDVWQLHGRLRSGSGGGTAEVRGARLMASGLPHPQWNNADITGPDVDVDALRRWYDDRRVPWGVRVPAGVVLDLGLRLFEKRCVALLPDRLRPVSPPPGVTIRRAGPEDLEGYAETDAAVFGQDVDLTRRWIAPMLGAPPCTLWLAEAGDAPIGVAHVARTDDRAGPAAALGGVGVLPGWPGLAGALSSAAAAAALAEGATLVHANPDDDEVDTQAALGFVEVPGFEVRLVVAPDEL